MDPTAADALPSVDVGNQQSAQPTRKRGYRRLADAMAWDPALMILPRFREANALNLICLQAEVADIEEKLNDAMNEDDGANDTERKQYSRNFDILRKHGVDSDQWKLSLQLREKLKEYNEALMQQFLINDRPSPDEYDYQTLHWWLKHPYGGAWDFRGAGSLTLDRPMNQLVMVAATSARTDPFIRWGTALLNILLRCIPWWKPESRPFAPNEENQTLQIYGSNVKIRSLGDKLTAILATIMILVPVIVLHFVKSANYRLIVIVLFSLSFVVAMSVLTQAKRSELVAATAAFIAVQVVYIGSALETIVPGAS